MALSAVRPLVVDFFETIAQTPKRNLRQEELEITGSSPFLGSTVKELRTSKGLEVLTLKRKDGEVLLTPGDETLIESGDGVVLLGTRP